MKGSLQKQLFKNAMGKYISLPIVIKLKISKNKQEINETFIWRRLQSY